LKYLILNGSPKKDGLCHSVTREIVRGAEDGGASVQTLTFEGIGRCRCCGGGWGSCFDKHVCSFGSDGFTEMQTAVKEAAALCIISPVYWHDLSEPLKAFLDRLRRCENPFHGNCGSLTNKPILLVAVPGGSGNGAIACLEQLSRFCTHTRSLVFDSIGVNRWTADYKHASVYSAAKAMAEGREMGDSCRG
jgi:multimeric flavodoxin WrbA